MKMRTNALLWNPAFVTQVKVAGCYFSAALKELKEETLAELWGQVEKELSSCIPMI